MGLENKGKTVFLTSSPDGSYQVDGEWVTGPFTGKNGFLRRFQEACPKNPRVLLITATPDEKEKNEEMYGYFTKVFAASKMPVRCLRLLGRSTAPQVSSWLRDSDVVILGGGHVPTQNRFFRELGLEEEIKGFGGVVMGISAGSMNCAHTVYAQPELDGEAKDPSYRRFITGLGLTRQNVLPHYQTVKDYTLDGLKLMEEVTYPDSIGREFYALEDGSYILCAGGREVVYGNAYRIADGEISQVCQDGGWTELPPPV